MNVLKRGLLTLLTLLGLLLAWSVAEPYFIDQRIETATVPNLPERWEGQRVAVVADFQVGMRFANTWTVKADCR